MVTNLVEKAVEEYWGMRCPDYMWGCTVCAAWKQYDTMREMALESKKEEQE
jgi:hypothetical protein